MGKKNYPNGLFNCTRRADLGFKVQNEIAIHEQNPYTIKFTHAFARFKYTEHLAVMKFTQC